MRTQGKLHVFGREGESEAAEDAVAPATYVHFWNWPQGLIGMPEVGDDVAIAPVSPSASILGHVVARVMYPDGILTDDGITYAVIHLEPVNEKDITGERLSQGGWRQEGV